MESIDLELGDLFDRDAVDEDEGDDAGAHPQGFDGEGDAPGDGQEGDEVISNLQKLAKGAAKKRVMKPQPKLDAQRLKSDRGLPCLPTLFKDVQFSGKGHETEDLKLLMAKLEHWSHRLFPKLSFDDFIERMEKLGARKEVQTCVKRIRLDMPIVDSDFVSAEGPYADEDNVMNAETAYDAMVRDELANQQQQQSAVDVDSDDEPLSLRRDTATVIESRDDASSTSNSQSLSSELTRRIEQNRLLAMQKRAARLSLLSSSVMESPSRQPCADAASGQNESVSANAHIVDTESTDSNCIIANVSTDVENNKALTSSTDMQTADEILNDLNSDDE